MKPEPSLTGVDRRESHRAGFHTDVEIEHGTSWQCCRTTNLSLDGLWIETPFPLEVGTEFRVRLFLRQGAPLEARCVVKQVTPGSGMGVAFSELSPAELARLRQLTQALPH
jgi:hypothetical protein